MISVLLTLVALALLVPASLLFLECTVAVLARHPLGPPTAGPRPTVAVLVPAHDEEAIIEPTIRALLSQLAPADRLLVIADNCSDGTAERARTAGATVVERQDEMRRGKGYALDHGVRYLSREPPEVVVVVDADCTLQPGALQPLARQAAASGRPAQSRYVMLPPAAAGPLHNLSGFAFLLRNVVRVSGLARIGQVCPLLGTGMAFPWSIIREAPLATGALTEDLLLGSHLAMAGHPAAFCFEALVTSPLASQERAQRTQRRRWEYGHLATIVSQGPRLIGAARRQRRPELLALALDLAVPPLSLLILLWLAALIAAMAAVAAGGSSLPAVLLGLAGVFILVSVAESWIAFGRRDYPLSSLLVAPFYVIAKIPMYVGLLVRRPREWVRTERGSGPQGGAGEGGRSRQAGP